jgi:thioredoxin reductase (NADPH)
LAHGRSRKVRSGETIVEPNAQGIKFFVLVAGRLELLLLSENKEEVIALCGPGMFTGELNVLSGRRGLVRIQASEPSELIEIERETLQGLVQTDSELSDIFLRAFILRRWYVATNCQSVAETLAIQFNLHTSNRFRPLL